MSIASWLRRRTTRAICRQAQPTRQFAWRPRLEWLEGRTVPTTYWVLNTNDAGPDSLRQAILDANAHQGPDKIGFNIPEDGVHTIQPLSPLPLITGTDGVVIDGYTQRGSHANTLANSTDAVLTIELDGTKAGAAPGLLIVGQNNLIQGLVINRFAGFGIEVGGAGNVVQGCYIGTDATGMADQGNGRVDGQSPGGGVQNVGSHNTIGGTTPAARNVISGNHTGAFGSFFGAGVWLRGQSNTVQGNFIGTNAAGTGALPNVEDGVTVIDGANNYGNTIGGAMAGARNVISGNGDVGVRVFGPSGTVIQGNYIGMDVTGAAAIGNGFEGVYLQNGASNSVVAGNTISGNLRGGVIATGLNNTIAGNRIGTNASGTAPLGNNGAGVSLSPGSGGNIIGGLAPGAGNVIGDNQSAGIAVTGSENNIIQGNYVGTDITQTIDLGNQGDGIRLTVSSNGNAWPMNNAIGGTTPGAGNFIAHNTGAGVVVAVAGTGNAIQGNRIFANGGLGIDLSRTVVNDGATPNDPGDVDTGPNGLPNFPVLTNVARDVNGLAVGGALNGTPNTTFRLEFFASADADSSGYGEGQTYRGPVIVTTDAGGNVSFTASGLGPFSASQRYLSATATNVATGDTSEFSQDFVIPLTTQTAVASSVNPSILGQTVTFTATVTPDFAGFGSPGGSVQFQVDASNVGAPVPLVGGVASFSTASLSPGTHTITALYSGDSTFFVSSSQVAQAVHYQFGGFLPPLDEDGSYKLGRDLPIKFRLTDYNSDVINSLSAVKSLQVQAINAQGQPTGTPFNPTATAGTVLRYDPVSQQFIFNWDTSGLTLGYYRVLLTLDDGTLWTLDLRLK